MVTRKIKPQFFTCFCYLKIIFSNRTFLTIYKNVSHFFLFSFSFSQSHLILSKLISLTSVILIKWKGFSFIMKVLDPSPPKKRDMFLNSPLSGGTLQLFLFLLKIMITSRTVPLGGTINSQLWFKKTCYQCTFWCAFGFNKHMPSIVRHHLKECIVRKIPSLYTWTEDGQSSHKSLQLPEVVDECDSWHDPLKKRGEMFHSFGALLSFIGPLCISLLKSSFFNKVKTIRFK